jgi:hypothetical protein
MCCSAGRGDAGSASWSKASYFKAIRAFSQIGLIYNTNKQIQFHLNGSQVLPSIVVALSLARWHHVALSNQYHQE